VLDVVDGGREAALEVGRSGRTPRRRHAAVAQTHDDGDVDGGKMSVGVRRSRLAHEQDHDGETTNV
jgi:hypothetical protein